VVLGGWLDLILEIFSNLYDSMKFRQQEQLLNSGDWGLQVRHGLSRARNFGMSKRDLPFYFFFSCIQINSVLRNSIS